MAVFVVALVTTNKGGEIRILDLLIKKTKHAIELQGYWPITNVHEAQHISTKRYLQGEIIRLDSLKLAFLL